MAVVVCRSGAQGGVELGVLGAGAGCFGGDEGEEGGEEEEGREHDVKMLLCLKRSKGAVMTGSDDDVCVV